MGIKIIGKVPRDNRAYLVASNHVSFFDPPLIGVFSEYLYFEKNLRFLAKEELFKINRHYAEFLHVLHAIPLKRDGLDINAINQAIELLKNNNSIVIFPEGTRNKTKELLVARPGVGYIALKSGVKIIPIYIYNINENIIKQILRIKRAKLIVGKPIELPNMRANSKNSKIATEIIMKEIRELRKYV